MADGSFFQRLFERNRVVPTIPIRQSPAAPATSAAPSSPADPATPAANMQGGKKPVLGKTAELSHAIEEFRSIRAALAEDEPTLVIPCAAVLRRLPAELRGPAWRADSFPDEEVKVSRKELLAQLKSGRVVLPLSQFMVDLPSGWLLAHVPHNAPVELDLSLVVPRIPREWIQPKARTSAAVPEIEQMHDFFMAKRLLAAAAAPAPAATSILAPAAAPATVPAAAPATVPAAAPATVPVAAPAAAPAAARATAPAAAPAAAPVAAPAAAPAAARATAPVAAPATVPAAAPAATPVAAPAATSVAALATVPVAAPAAAPAAARATAPVAAPTTVPAAAPAAASVAAPATVPAAAPAATPAIAPAAASVAVPAAAPVAAPDDVPVPAPAAADYSNWNGRDARVDAGPNAIDINRATHDDLLKLPGVGPHVAAAILAHRQQHGPFTSVFDLATVEGVGPRLFRKLTGLSLQNRMDRHEVLNVLLGLAPGARPSLSLIAQNFSARLDGAGVVLSTLDGMPLAASQQVNDEAVRYAAIVPQMFRRTRRYFRQLLEADVHCMAIPTSQPMLLLVDANALFIVVALKPEQDFITIMNQALEVAHELHWLLDCRAVVAD